ncbi:hypothetical protein Cgig2_024737 [Carnegiea gigantea]|uniref:alpha-amylase n=1 Tax=Carnegiea gigantea TaxID=171969 RepID=A0A9Q1Q6Q5_9CARY|nr:hypothetical protein Cgig2_024737 [Carnegiea gigantea]
MNGWSNIVLTLGILYLSLALLPILAAPTLLFQGFNWESWNKKGGLYNFLKDNIDDLARAGVTHIWLPPPGHSVYPQGFDGWGFDFVKGYSGSLTKIYMDRTRPDFAVGELWDSITYRNGAPDYNQDAHRNELASWVRAAGGSVTAFDFTTKGVLQVAVQGQWVNIMASDADLYMAMIDDKVIVKNGSGYDTATLIRSNYKVAAYGNDYCVWVK